MPTVTLRLTDPYFYHLDTALFALDEENIAYYPEVFSPGSREVLRRLYPDAIVATRDGAMDFGLNSVLVRVIMRAPHPTTSRSHPGRSASQGRAVFGRDATREAGRVD